MIPIGIVLALVTGAEGRGNSANYALSSGGTAFVATVLMLLFRHKYPRWWFDWNLALTRFGTRVLAYLALLRDEYPSTDDEQAVHVAIPYPNATLELNRWLPLIKWVLAIPHYIVLGILGIAAMCCVPLGAPSRGVCVPAHDRSLSAVQRRGVSSSAAHVRDPSRGPSKGPDASCSAICG